MAAREAEWAELRETMVMRDIENMKAAEQLRKALLQSEAQREADAASFIEVMEQRQAAQEAVLQVEATRRHMREI
jgi:hypothetical protein